MNTMQQAIDEIRADREQREREDNGKQAHWTRAIYDAVQARGYTQGAMARDQYAFSQLCKMVDELYEYAIHFDGTAAEKLSDALIGASLLAKQLFNTQGAIGDVNIPWEDAAQRELADVLVTVAMSAEVLQCDVEAMAIEKARGDVKRGVC